MEERDMTTEIATTPRIGVYHERCIGAGNCAEVAPDYFDQDPVDGTVVVLQEQVVDGDQDEVEEAVDICPVAAIFLSATPAGS
jgi:ferredoxin